MPRRTLSIPKYRHHKASRQAVVTLNGRDFYLGPYDTKTSRNEYDRLVGEWQANGRQLRSEYAPHGISMVEVLNGYRKFANGYYVKNGKPTGSICGVRVGDLDFSRIVATAIVAIPTGTLHSGGAEFIDISYNAAKNKCSCVHSRP